MKKLLILFLGVTTLFGLAGCGSTSSDTLSFWAYQPSTTEDLTEFKELIAEFTAETGIKVNPNFVAKDNYKRTLNSALSSSKKPDVSFLDQPMIADYAADGTLADITSLLTADIFDKDNYFDGAYDTTIYNEKRFGVPLNVTTSVLFYNKSLVSVENVPTTLEEMLNLNVASDKALFEGIGTGGYAAWYFQVFLENFGGQLIDIENKNVTFNNTQGQEAAKYIQDLYAKSPKNIRDSNNAFGNGNVMFKLGSSSDIETLQKSFPGLDFGVTLIPSGSTTTSYSNIGGENLVVFNHSDLKEEAVQLIEFLMEKENNQKICDYTGNLSSIKDYAETTDELEQVVINQLATACARPSIADWITVNDNYIGAALEFILADSPQDIKEKLDFAAQQANSLLFNK